MPKRPVGILIVGIFLLAGTLIAILTGISLAHPGTFLDAMWKLNPNALEQFSFLGKLAGYLLLGISVITALAGFGILRGRKWGWWIAVAIFGINGAGDAVNIFVGEPLKGLAGLIIAGCFLFYMIRPATRTYFVTPASYEESGAIR